MSLTERRHIMQALVFTAGQVEGDMVQRRFSD
jgi:hypothetical protein